MLADTIYEGRCAHIDWRVAEHPRFLAWCGYVRLPEDHPWRHMPGESIPVDVHGGVTYGPDGDGWIGFDTMHAGDAIVLKSPLHEITGGRQWTPIMAKRETNRFAIHADDAYVRR